MQESKLEQAGACVYDVLGVLAPRSGVPVDPEQSLSPPLLFFCNLLESLTGPNWIAQDCKDISAEGEAGREEGPPLFGRLKVARVHCQNWNKKNCLSVSRPAECRLLQGLKQIIAFIQQFLLFVANHLIL